MKPEQLDFDTVSAEKLKMLEEVKDMVFSTCSGNHVTSRIVSTACRGTKILFASFRNNIKCVQIMDNPNAAFCFGNMQIEGAARIVGTPQDPNNAELMELYKEKQLRYYDYVLNDERMALILFEVKRITYNPPKTELLDKIDFENRTAYRIAMYLEL
jgi:general stress protein 26